jgi:hypothetical protein
MRARGPRSAARRGSSSNENASTLGGFGDPAPRDRLARFRRA